MMTDKILFELFPYIAVAIAIVGSILRYRLNAFSYSSLSSQFLESQQLFYGSVPWHYGILIVLTGHFLAFLFPRELLVFNSVPLRLYILETTALIFGLLALVGLVNLVVRRLWYPRIRAVTSVMDAVLLGVLLAQVLLGVYIATNLRWGSSWFATLLAPYLYSLCIFKPDVTLLGPLPLVVKLHIFGAFLLIALTPFTRLVHIFVVPVQYLWRRPQIVIWNRLPKEVRNP
jgi:nitrate reductase gamma subunit